MVMKIYVIGIIVVFTLGLSSIALTPTTALQTSSKGLKALSNSRYKSK